MKKHILLATIAILVIALLAGCTPSGTNNATESSAPTEDASASVQPDETQSEETAEPVTIIVGASPTPHAEILAIAKRILAEQGYNLEIIEFTDYVQPNLTLANGDIDANYFQHLPYLEDFNVENNTDIVSIADIHYEPFGIFPGKTATLEELADGSQVAVPNDTTNEARALLLLEAQGLIKINPNAGLQATINDITENPKNLKIVELEAAQLARALPDVEIAVINGNYAIQAGLNAATDALAIEDKDSLAAATFANILAVRSGDESRDDLQALVAALQSDEVKQYINDTYQGAVVTVF